MEQSRLGTDPLKLLVATVQRILFLRYLISEVLKLAVKIRLQSSDHSLVLLEGLFPFSETRLPYVPFGLRFLADVLYFAGRGGLDFVAQRFHLDDAFFQLGDLSESMA